MTAPLLETERLILRGHQPEDFACLAKMWADPAVTRFIREKPFTFEESWSRYLRYVGHWNVLGYGYWAVREKASGHFIGEAGLADYHRDIEPSLDGTPEIGWVLSPAFHGRGYATEAVRRITQWADSDLRARRTACIIAPENLPSIHVAEKCGYRELLRTTYHGSPTLLFERNRTSPLD